MVGSVVNHYGYTPFGAVSNPFQIVGKLGVMKESNNLEFMRARYYDASLGRFGVADPIELYGGDVNFYRYCGNDPIGHVDPSGLGFYDWRGWIWVQQIVAAFDRLGPAAVAGGLTDLVTGAMYIKSWENRTCASLAASGGNCSYFDTTSSGNPSGGSSIPFSAPTGAGGGSPPGNQRDSEHTESRFPRDPEDKFGPAGYDPPGTLSGSEVRYVPGGEMLDYRIEFWNHPDAVIAAQDATMEDILDPSVYDLSTFELIRVGLLDWDVPLSGGQAAEIQIDMRPEMNLLVDVTGTFDPDTGIIFW